MQLNLKFEIEVLCKNLALDINELKPGNLLKDKDRLKNLDEQLSAPKKDVKQPEELPAITTTSKYRSLAFCQPVSSQTVHLYISKPLTIPPCIKSCLPFGESSNNQVRVTANQISLINCPVS